MKPNFTQMNLSMITQRWCRCSCSVSLQAFAGFTWPGPGDHVPQAEILAKTNCRMQCQSIEATQHQLHWLGHGIQMPRDQLPPRVLYGQLHQCRRLAGGPKRRCEDQLKTSLIQPEDLDPADLLSWRRTTARRQQQGLRRNPSVPPVPPVPPPPDCMACLQQDMWFQDSLAAKELSVQVDDTIGFHGQP